MAAVDEDRTLAMVSCKYEPQALSLLKHFVVTILKPGQVELGGMPETLILKN